MDTIEPMPRLRRRDTLSQIARLLDVGVIWLSPELEPEICSDRALRLLGESTDSNTPSEATLHKMLRKLGLGTGKWESQIAQDAQASDPELREADLDLGSGHERRHLRLQLHAVPEDECDLSYLILVRDRAALEAVETDLKMAAKLRGLNRLYRGVAHDLKAPLNAMRLNLDLLTSILPQAQGPDCDPPRASLRIVEQELSRLQRSLQMLLEQTAPAQANKEVFEFGQLVKDIVAFLAPEAEQRGVEVDVRLPHDLVPLFAQRDAVHQIVINLAINGFEAMPDGGRLSFVVQRQDDQGILVVSDSGPGVPAQIAARIFELHFTTKASSLDVAGPSGGTGIGLHVSALAARQAGGSLTLLPETSAGASFELRLPLATDLENVEEKT